MPYAQRIPEVSWLHVVQDVQFKQHRAPAGEGGTVIQHGHLAAEPELPEVDMLKHLERAHAKQLRGAGHRGVQVVHPVPDVVQSTDG